LSLLITGVVLAASYNDLREWPNNVLARWWVALLLWSLPFVAILELARRRRTEALGLALGFGATGVGVVWWVPQWMRSDTEYSHTFGMFLVGLLVTAVFQGIMAVGAAWNWWKSRPLQSDPRFGPELALWSGLLVGVALPPIVLSAGPMRSMWTHQASPLGSIRIINTAEITYASTYDSSFSPTLAALGPPPASGQPSAEHAGLVPDCVSNGECYGYTFTYTPGPRDAAERIHSYTLSARPMKYRETGTISYSTDQTGVIRQTTEDRPATANDPPIAG